ncbi:protein YgfX [Zoogloea sp.]|uniref:protein YgfX n=1 Tax=Zoogloea sp. TaxID=49181 RepID=UPI002612F370|nr:protein YgfX [Zoogloea sp.]MDD3354111.1 hypothetical protein [Zoogloea sp.]
MICIEPRPSRLLATFLVVLHAATALAFLSVLGVTPLFLGMLTLLVLSLARALDQAFRQGICLFLRGDGCLALVADGPPIPLAPATVVASRGVWLVWRDDASGRRRTCLLLADQLAPDVWRQLQIWARLRAVRPQEAPADEGRP